MRASTCLPWLPAAGVIALAALVAPAPARAAPAVRLTAAEWTDRAEAIWAGQIIGVLLGYPFEHKPASVAPVTRFHTAIDHAPVDDDWYYEMVALRAFERYGPGLTVRQLGRQWVENAAGAWGSSEQARLLLARGIDAPDSGHPRHNKLWFTIGPQFSSELYGALAPGMPNLAGRLARTLGHVNGYAEAVDGAVFMAGMVSLGFVEPDVRAIVRGAATLIDRRSPYRQCLDEMIALAQAGAAPARVFDAIEDRWHHVYPATNNAVANGCLVAAGLWFGGGDFGRTLDLLFRAADFTDADCNAANAAAVLGAMHGMAALPRDLVAALHDRIAGARLGPVALTPPVDESISGLARRTVAVGERLLAREGVRRAGDALLLVPQTPVTQPPELFSLADLMQFWAPPWTLERAGFGGAGGGVVGMRGITALLDGEVLSTYPRDEVRGLVLRRVVALPAQPRLRVEVAADPGRAWQLEVLADNRSLLRRLIEGRAKDGQFEEVSVDLAGFAGHTVTLRLLQTVLVGAHAPGSAYWRNLRVDGADAATAVPTP